MSMFGFLAVILGPLMRLVYGIIPNFAVTLIVFTILVRLVSLPLDVHQQKLQAKNAIFTPMITEIQQKYKNNQQKQQEELMRLQQDYGYNPLSGCWPMLLNMAVLFGVIEVVYRPVQYILAVPADNIRMACESLGIDVTTQVNVMQTQLIQRIHAGAPLPTGLTAEQYAAIQNFNTSFFGMDMCEEAGFRLTPLLIIPLVASVTLFLSTWLMQKITGMEAQMQGSMKYTMLFMNLIFVFYCFRAPVGFSLYYGTSNICMVLRTLVTNKFYSPEKYKAAYEAELAAKKAASRSKKTLTVEEGGKTVTKQVSNREMDRLRLERARQLEEEKYAGERTTPLPPEELAAQIEAARKNPKKAKQK